MGEGDLEAAANRSGSFVLGKSGSSGRLRTGTSVPPQLPRVTAGYRHKQPRPLARTSIIM